jgi:hypothetical protein
MTLDKDQNITIVLRSEWTLLQTSLNTLKMSVYKIEPQK